MTAWYKKNPGLYRKEQAAIALAQPGMALDIRPSGFRINQEQKWEQECAIAAGIYRLQAPNTMQYDYRIAVVLLDDYPNSPCVVYCNDPKLPIGNIDRHILANGQACLATPADLMCRWKPESGITGFLDEFVAPFLAWQVHFDAYGYPPPWGQRSHGIQGIIEFYAEMLDIPIEPYILKFIPLLAKKNLPKGHEPCPCGYGQRLRKCHFQSVKRARGFISWQIAISDLAALPHNVMITA